MKTEGDVNRDNEWQKVLKYCEDRKLDFYELKTKANKTEQDLKHLKKIQGIPAVRNFSSQPKHRMRSNYQIRALRRAILRGKNVN